MKIELNLRFAENPQRPAVAWLFARGAEPETLSEVAAWPISHSTIEFKRLDAGLLVILSETDAANVRPEMTSAVPYGAIGKRLFVPTQSIFTPCLTDVEIVLRLPSDDASYVWHPQSGLMCCGSDESFRFADLLQPPQQCVADWGRAVPGTKLNSRLVSIEPITTLSADELMQEARDGIGSQANNLRGLPRSPREMTPLRLWLPRLFQMSVMWLPLVLGLGLLVWFISHLLFNNDWLESLLAVLYLVLLVVAVVALSRWISRNSFSGPSGENPQRKSSSKSPTRTTSSNRGGVGQSNGWFAGARRWIEQRRQHFNEQLEALRHREIERLLHMLDARPEDGLRYAISMGSNAWHRGVAGAGSQLTARGIDFSLSRLGGGEPVDNWDIGDAYRQRLLVKYRELAKREISLGNHRRAAYIFAELLGDLRAAASTLADGRQYREAAALYDERLNDKLAAAQCLERGGLLMEAIPLFRKLEHHEKVAELFEQLQQPDFAAQAYRQAVDVKLQRSDYLAAAKLLENKLHVPDEAQATLLQGWPHSSQARLCLDESFHILARQAAHTRAAQQIDMLLATTGKTEVAVTAATCLSQVAKNYPDAQIQHLAADQTRVLVSHRLAAAISGERPTLLEAIRQLAPEDRLLTRDCVRYGQAASPRSRVAGRAQKISIAREFCLPEGNWKTVVATGNSFYAAGYRDDDIILVRGLWDGMLHQPSGKPWRVPVAKDEILNTILLAGSSRSRGSHFVHLLGQGPIQSAREFPETDRFWSRTVGGHPAFDEYTGAICVSHGNRLDILKFPGSELVLETHSIVPSVLLGSTSVTGEGITGAVDEWGLPPIPLIRAGGRMLTANRAGIICIEPSGHARLIQLPHRILNLISSDEIKFDQIVGTHEQGATLWFGNPANEQSHFFANDLLAPKVCILGRKLLAAADEGRIEVYDTDDERIRFHTSHVGPNETPIALLTTNNQSEAALFTNSGRVIIYAIA